MGDRRDKVVLHPVQLLQAGVGCAQLAGGGLQFGLLELQFAAVRTHLIGLIEDIEHLIEPQRLLLHHRGHHHPRRSRADGTGQFGLGKLDKCRIGRQAAPIGQSTRLGMAGQLPVRPLRPEKALKQRHQRLRRGLPAPEARRTAPCLQAKHIDEPFGLRRLIGIRARCQRHTCKQPGVDQQAPPQTMRNLIQADQAEQRLRLQPRKPEQAALHETRIDPARLGKGRQQQGIQPDQKAAAQAGNRPRARPEFPVHATEDHGGKLGDRRKRNQADTDQRMRLSGRLKIDESEQQDHTNRGTPDPQQHTRKITPILCRKPRRPQETRHHQIVADHGGQGDGFDDHHPGCRRQAPEENEHGQYLGPLR